MLSSSRTGQVSHRGRTYSIYIHFAQVGDLENMYKFNFEGDESEMSKMADELEKDDKVVNFSCVPGCCVYIHMLYSHRQLCNVDCTMFYGQ